MFPLHCLLLLALAAADVPETKLEVPTKPQNYRGPGHWATPAPDSGVDVGFVPQRLYAQVRHTSTVRHLPRSAALAEASTPEEVVAAPRLREVVRSTKLSEVYSEEGYEDSAYDHAGYDKNAKQEEDYETKEKSKKHSKSRPRSHHDDDSQSQGSNPQISEIGVEGERKFTETKTESPSVKRKIVRKSNLFVEMQDEGYDSEPRRLAAEYIHTIQHPFSIVPESVLSFHDPREDHRVSDDNVKKTMRHSPGAVTRRLHIIPSISTSTTTYSHDVEASNGSDDENGRRHIRKRISDVYREVDSSLSDSKITGTNYSVSNKLNSAKTPKNESQSNNHGHYETETSRKPFNATTQQNYTIIQRRKPVDIQLNIAPSLSSADPRSNWNHSPHKDRDPLAAVSQMETYDWFPRPFKPTVYSTSIQDRSDSLLPTANYKTGEIPLIPMQLPEEPDEIIIVIKSKSADTEDKIDNLESLAPADSNLQKWNSSPYSKHPTLPLESRELKPQLEHASSETNPSSISITNEDTQRTNKQTNTRYPNRALHSARYRAALSTLIYKSTTVATPMATETTLPSEQEKNNSLIPLGLDSKNTSSYKNETKLKLFNIERTNSTLTAINGTKDKITQTDSSFSDQFSISNFWAPIKKLVESNIPMVKYVPRQEYSQLNEKIEDSVHSDRNTSNTFPMLSKLTKVKTSMLNFKGENDTSANNTSHNPGKVGSLNREIRDTIFNTSLNMSSGAKTADKILEIKDEEINSEERVSFGDRIVTGKQGKYDKVINRRPVLNSKVSDNPYEIYTKINTFEQIPPQNRSDNVYLRDSLVQGREKRFSGNPIYLNSEEEEKIIESEIEEIDKEKEIQIFEEGKEWEEAIRNVENGKRKEQLNREKYPFYVKQPINSLSVHSPLRYALNPILVPRKTEGGMEFYESRETIQCPEVSPKLSDIVPKRKSQGQWNKEPRPRNLPRLRGLGDKLDCLKVKYWGEEPLDNPFFSEDSIEVVEKSKAGRFERVASDEATDFFADVFDAVENIKNLGRYESKSSPAADRHSSSTKQFREDKNIKDESSTKTIDSKSSNLVPILNKGVPEAKFESLSERIIGLYPPPISLYRAPSNTQLQDNITSNYNFSSIPPTGHIVNDTGLSDYMTSAGTVPIPVTMLDGSGESSSIIKLATTDSHVPNQGSRIIQNYEENPTYEQERNLNLNHYIELLSSFQRSRNNERRPDSDHNASDRSYNRVWNRGSSVNEDERSKEPSRSMNDQRRGEPRYSDVVGYERNVLPSRKNSETKREHRRRNRIDNTGNEAASSTAEGEESVANSEVNPPFENYPSTYNVGLTNRKNQASESKTRNKPNDKSFEGKSDISNRYSDGTHGKSQHTTQERVDKSLSGTKRKSDIERFKDLGLWLSPEQINEVLGAFINKHKVLLSSLPAPDDSTSSPAAVHLRGKSRSQSAASEIRDFTTEPLPNQSEEYSTELPMTSTASNGRPTTLKYSTQLEVSTVPPDYYRKRKPQPRTTIRTVTESTNEQERRKPSRTNPWHRNRSRTNEVNSARTSPRTPVNLQQEDQRGSWKSSRSNSTGPLHTAAPRKQNSRSNNSGVRQQSRDNSRSSWQQRTSSRTSTEATPTTTESPRRVKAVEHRRVTKEEVFTRTYIPHGDSEDEQGEESERYEELEPRVEYSTEEDIYEPFESYQQQNGYVSSRENYLTTQKSFLDNKGNKESLKDTQSENYPDFQFNAQEDTGNRDGGKLRIKPKTVTGSISPVYECPRASEITETKPLYSSTIESRRKNVNGEAQNRNRFHTNEFTGESVTSHVPVTTEGSQSINVGVRDSIFDSVTNLGQDKYESLPRIGSDRRELETATQKSYNINPNRQIYSFPRHEFKRIVDKTEENKKPITEYEDKHKKGQTEHETEKDELNQNKKVELNHEEGPNSFLRNYSNKQNPALSYPDVPREADTLMYSVDPRTGLGKWSPETSKKEHRGQNRRPDLDYRLQTDSSKLSDYHVSAQDTDRRRNNDDISSKRTHFPRRVKYYKNRYDQVGKDFNSNDDGKSQTNTNENTSKTTNREDSKSSERYSGKRGHQLSMKDAADSLYKDYEAQLYQDRPVEERGQKNSGDLHIDDGAEASNLSLEHQVYILSKILSSLPPRQRAGVVKDLAESMQRSVLPTHAVADPGQRMYYYALPADGARSKEETGTLRRRTQKS